MMNALVVYRSCYGATRRYAEWISTMLSANLCEEKYLREEMLRSSDVIIFGSGIYAEKVAAAAMIARVTGWFGQRTPTVSRPPVVRSGTMGLRGRIIVRGPGQNRSAIA